MKASYIENFGNADVIKTGNLPDPECGKSDVIIEVKAAALNHLDIWVRMGRPGKEMQFPHILGSDASGIVKATGSDVHGISIGDEVVINPGIGCGYCDYCRAGEQSECVSFGIMGLSRAGTFADYTALPYMNIYRKPEHLSFQEAAAFPLTYLTAWRMIVSKGELKPGQTILIHGIGGGVAQAALKIAKLMGANIIVTSSSRQKLESAIKNGAHHAILYTENNIAEKVKEFTSGRGADLIIDSVGAATMQINHELAKKGGRIVLCGVTSGAKTEINLQALYWNQLKIFGSTMGSNNEFKMMIDFININKIRPEIDSVFPLSDTIKATELMEKGAQTGKIILDLTL